MTTYVPAFMHDPLGLGTRDQTVDAYLERVRNLYAPFDVQVVRRKPAIANYSRVVIGGDRQLDARFEAVPNAVGVAAGTIACTAVDNLERGLAFVFSGTIYDDPTSSVHTLTSVIAHEAGHMFGLDHSAATGSLMFPASGLQAPTWGTGPVDASASCGRATQDDVAVLMANLGAHRANRLPVPLADATPPTITSVSPVDATTITGALVPCLSASSAAGLRMAMVELFTVHAIGRPIGRRLRFEARTSPPFTFSPIVTSPRDGLLFRFTVVDVNGNLTESRSTINYQASGATAPPCP